jgi:hypothetical protein
MSSGTKVSITLNASPNVGAMKIWFSPSPALLVDQPWPMWPLRTPVLVNPQETWHGGKV